MDKNSIILRIENISKRFEGVHALDGVSFSIKEGHIKALIGPNGAGKTTMLNVINGLIPPDEGRIFFGDNDITGQPPDVIASLGIGRTFQLIRLFTINEATVMDNLLIGASLELKPGIIKSIFFPKKIKRQEKKLRDKALDILNFVGLSGKEGFLPNALSFGNQRLVELARALMMDPKMLILDEPASGLNDKEVENFKELLLSIKKRGITMLLVEHNMKLVMDIADDIVVLDFGKKLTEGSPKEVCANPDVIAAYLGTTHKTGEGLLCSE
ncbi:MAG TPA: ABC transporter ATP-binding protein [Syntrophorhabdaceae bacterium]|nr:ABC transporter ATP-binding protein [Syntrophorhabdaceae bacterium]HPP06181.1 ABC transporter ATP-binding protein [Syntrophorhabdaceae bacterium]